jgi:hypothetical protein
MSRYVIGSNVTVGGVMYYRDQVAELTSAQASAITGAGGKIRLASNPVNVNGTAPGSPTHDTNGEASGVSNSA